MKKVILIVLKRIANKTPRHFKRIRNAGIISIGVGIAIKVTALFFPATLPEAIVGITTNLIGYGIAAATISQTAEDK